MLKELKTGSALKGIFLRFQVNQQKLGREEGNASKGTGLYAECQPSREYEEERKGDTC